jgi:hypothetical protein
MTLFVGLLIGHRLLPRPDSLHFKALLIQSMASRYANFVRDGDHVRGDAMKVLLQKAGVESDSLAGQSNGPVVSATTQASDETGLGRS